MNPEDPEFAAALREAASRVEALHADLRETYPLFQGNLAVSGVFVGAGLGAFVASGLSDDQIVGHVRLIVAQIRQTITELQAASRSEA